MDAKLKQVEALSLTYESPDDIELMAGIIAEKSMPGVAIGPTLGCVMATQMLRWRRADRFWYENRVHPGALTKEQLLEIRKITLSRIICDHGEEVDMIQPNAFVLAGHGNEMTKCSNIPTPDLSAWTDPGCVQKKSGDNSGIFDLYVVLRLELIDDLMSCEIKIVSTLNTNIEINSKVQELPLI